MDESEPLPSNGSATFDKLLIWDSESALSLALSDCSCSAGSCICQTLAGLPFRGPCAVSGALHAALVAAAGCSGTAVSSAFQQTVVNTSGCSFNWSMIPRS